MQTSMNVHYVKRYNKMGKVINEITKNEPYENYGPSNRGQNQNSRRINNRKPTRGRDRKRQLITFIKSVVSLPILDKGGFAKGSFEKHILGHKMIVHKNL